MTNPNKAELRRLAEAALAGDWFKAGDLLCFDVKTGESHGLNVEDDRFIDAFTPAAVLSLLDECHRLQATCEGLDRQNDAIAEEIGKFAAERDAALAELEAIKSSGWRNHSVNYARAEKCPQTLETAQAAWDRDQELIEEQRQQIAKDSQTINDLRQKLEACRKDAERYQRLRGASARDHGIAPDKFDAEFDAALKAIDAAMSQEANHA